MAETQLNIYQKLAKIRKPVEVLKKNKAGFGYTYVTEDEILAGITGTMERQGVSLIPRIIPGTTKLEPYPYVKTKTIKDKTGAIQSHDENLVEFIVTSDLEFHWVDNAHPDDRIVIPWSLVGTSATDASQALGSGLTYATRYFLLKYFNVATPDDDPDNWRSKQLEATLKEEREFAEKIIEEVDARVQALISANEDSKPAIAKLVKRFARDADDKPSTNYFFITEPKAATALLEELIKLEATVKKGTK